MQIVSLIFESEAAALAALNAANAGLVDANGNIAHAGFDASGARFDVFLSALMQPGVGTVIVPAGDEEPAPPTPTGQAQVDLFWQGATAPTIAGGTAASAPAVSFSPPTPTPAAFSPDAVLTECKNRILAVASTNCQINMAAARAAGILTADQDTAFAAGLAWINSMRAACTSMINAADPTFMAESHWPACPANVVALAANF